MFILFIFATRHSLLDRFFRFYLFSFVLQSHNSRHTERAAKQFFVCSGMGNNKADIFSYFQRVSDHLLGRRKIAVAAGCCMVAWRVHERKQKSNENWQKGSSVANNCELHSFCTELQSPTLPGGFIYSGERETNNNESRVDSTKFSRL